jgi:hypothetical protein
VYRVIGETEPRIKAFGGQVGDLERIGGIGLGQALGDFFREAVGKGMGIVMSDNDECVHGKTPHGNDRYQAGMLG